VVPVRDEEPSIHQFIESLLCQTVSPTEIIIADGGSTDKTKDIIQEYMRRGDPLRLIEDLDAYPGRARNLAIEQAGNEWVAMTDAGTIVEPDWLENLVRVATSERDTDVVLGSYEPILPSFFKECLALTFVAPAMPTGQRHVRGPSTASLMIKKNVWKSLGGFPEHLRAGEDLLFFDKLDGSRFIIRRAPDAIVRWNIPDDFAGIFRRFRSYSLHTLKGGQGGRWHMSVARMYLVGLVLLGLAVLHHWSWTLIVLVGLAGRVHRTIRVRRSSLKIAHRMGPHTYFVVAVLLLLIDLAAFVGALDYLFKRRDQNRFKRRATRR
jgi:glycosyltransferase involved in cell wall biosynthesis